jgi:hypothetical protein
VVATALDAWSTNAGAQTLPVPITAPHVDLTLEPNVESDSGRNPPIPGHTVTLPFAVDVTIGIPAVPTEPASPPPDTGTMAEDDSAALHVSADGCLAAALLSSRAPDGCNVPTAGVETPAQVAGTGEICIDGTLANVPIGECREAGFDTDDPSLPIDPDDPGLPEVPGGPDGPGLPEDPLAPLCDVPIVGDIVSDILCPESATTPPAPTPETPGDGVGTPGFGSPLAPGGGGGAGSGTGAPSASAAGDNTALAGALPFTGGSSAFRLALVGTFLVGLGLAARRWARLRSLGIS